MTFVAVFRACLLPRYDGESAADVIARERLPMRVRAATAAGVVDEHFGHDKTDVTDRFRRKAGDRARDCRFAGQPGVKRRRRNADDREKPPARYNFVCKVPTSRTPLTIAKCRRTGHVGKVRKFA